MGDSSMKAQVSARRHAEEVDDFMRDMAGWESRMKAKDAELRGNKVSKMDLPAKKSQGKENGEVAVRELVTETETKFRSSLKVAAGGDTLQKRQFADQLKDKGNALFKAKKYKEAVSCYSEGMENDPLNPLLPANRAMALLKLDMFADAEADCDMALHLDPTYVKAYLRRGSARLSRDNLIGAEADYAKALELEPSNKQAAVELEKIRRGLVPDKSPLSSAVVERDPIGFVGGKIAPITKPLADRSKVPLQRIEVKEVPLKKPSKLVKFSEAEAKPTSEEPTSNEGQEPRVIDEAVQKADVKPAKDVEKNRVTLPTTPQAETLPERVPKNCQEFFRDWDSMSFRKDWRLEYLMRIDPDKLPSIFKDFLTSDVLGQILEALASSGTGADVEEKPAVFPVLKGLTKVDRFDLQAMFLPEDHKNIARTLLSAENLRGVEEADRQSVWQAFDL